MGYELRYNYIFDKRNFNKTINEKLFNEKCHRQIEIKLFNQFVEYWIVFEMYDSIPTLYYNDDHSINNISTNCQALTQTYPVDIECSKLLEN